MYARLSKNGHYIQNLGFQHLLTIHAQDLQMYYKSVLWPGN
jgi:hypothetical protein